MRFFALIALLLSAFVSADVVVTEAAAIAGSGTQDITVSGFGTPTAAIVEVTYATALNTDTAHAGLSLGYTDGTNQGATYFNAEDAVTPSDNNNGHSPSLTVLVTTPGQGTGAIIRSATASFITDGIRLTWVQTGAAYRVKVTLFTDVGTTLAGNFTPNATQNGTANITTTFTPKLGFFAQNGNTNGSSTPVEFSMGIMHYANPTITQRAIKLRQSNGEATPVLVARIATDRVTTNADNNGVAANYGTEVTAVGATSVTLTTRDGTVGGAVPFLLIELPANNAWIGTVDAPTTAASDWVFTAVGFQPAAFGLLLTDLAVVGTDVNNSANAGPFGIYTADGTREFSANTARELAVINTQSRMDSKLYLPTHNGTEDQSMTAPTLTASGWTFSAANITTANAAKFVGWAIEADAIGAPLHQYQYRRRRQ